MQAYENFIQSRRNNGKQRLTEILSLHSAARQVLWPYSYTKNDVPSDMTADDHAAFVALGKGVAKRNGYKPQQGSDLYIVDGDQDDNAYATQGIFAITIEMSKGSAKRYYPSLKELNADLNRNRNAVLWFLQQADCPYRPAGLAAVYCASSADVPSYSQSVYDQNDVQPQQTNCWCAVASTRAMLEGIDASISVAQTDVNDYMVGHDKYDWTSPAFSGYLRCTGGSPSPSYAHDGRGMSWTLWHYASPDQSLGFNDYRSTNQAAMNWSIVRGIRATGQSVGVVVAAGKHAILAVGYQTRSTRSTMPVSRTRSWVSESGIRTTGPGSATGRPGRRVALRATHTSPSTTGTRATSGPIPTRAPTTRTSMSRYMRSSVAEPPSDNPAQSYGDWRHDQLTATPSRPQRDPDGNANRDPIGSGSAGCADAVVQHAHGEPPSPPRWPTD